MDSPPRRARNLAGVVLALGLASCGNLSFQRRTETSGTFSSSGFAMTLFGVDLPMGALQIARENASDANLANMEVGDVVIVPYLGPVDWLLDIVGFRYARIEGTWGFSGE
jgi:hypothetical protein